MIIDEAKLLEVLGQSKNNLIISDSFTKMASVLRSRDAVVASISGGGRQ